VYGFNQEDLLSDSLYVIDAGYEAYVWIGKDAPKAEREAAADAGLAHARSGVARRADIPLMLVKQGCEPRQLTSQFTTWVSDAATVRARACVRGECAAHFV
jgi:hypothetical protein